VSVQAHVCNAEGITGDLLFKIGENWNRIVKNENLETERAKEMTGEEKLFLLHGRRVYY
jgi:hypothetical protein